MLLGELYIYITIKVIIGWFVTLSMPFCLLCMGKSRGSNEPSRALEGSSLARF